MQKRITHKKVAGIVGVLAIVALLLTGTFAWTASMNQINEFVGTPADKDMGLHDDYDPETGEKAVYIENAGKGTMFVRIRLDEFMDLTQYTPPASIDWTTHIPDTAVNDCGLSNDLLEKFHDYFTWVMGGQKYYLPGNPGTITQDTKDYTPGSDDYNALTPEEQALVKQTPVGEVITMALYMTYTDEQKAAYVGWIYDTDGYAYWSQPLFAGNVTGLLLNSVITDASVKEQMDYYYAINVIAEAVDYQDLDMWLSGKASIADSTKLYDEATPDAKYALNIIKDIKETIDESKVVTSLEIDTAPAKVTYAKGETFDPTGLKLKVTYADNTTEVITSGYSYSPAGALRTDHTEVTFKYGGQTVTQTITVNE